MILTCYILFIVQNMTDMQANNTIYFNSDKYESDVYHDANKLLFNKDFWKKVENKHTMIIFKNDYNKFKFQIYPSGSTYFIRKINYLRRIVFRSKFVKEFLENLESIPNALVPTILKYIPHEAYLNEEFMNPPTFEYSPYNKQYAYLLDLNKADLDDYHNNFH